MNRAIKYIEKFISSIGTAVSLLVLLIVLLISYEVCMRYFFNAPTSWVHDLTGWLQTGFVMLGGAYALQKDHFVRVDVFYAKFSPKVRVIIDLTLSSFLLGVFMYVLIHKGIQFSYKSFVMSEVSATGAWQGRVWPAKFAVPVGAGMLLLAWAAKLYKDISVLMRRST